MALEWFAMYSLKHSQDFFLLFALTWLQVIACYILNYFTTLPYLLKFLPNLLSHAPGGIQFATAQLPLLELMDCGMTICDPNFPNPTADKSDCKSQKTSSTNLHHINQKLIIKHNRLKKLSLWGCSGLDVSFIRLKPFIAYSFLGF